MKKVAVILLTWGRPNNFKKTLEMLDAQEYKNFTLYVSSGNTKIHNFCKSTAEEFKASLEIKFYDDGNDYMCFRRFFLAKELAKSGVDIVINIDDDIVLGPNFVGDSVAQFEPETIKAVSAIHLHNGESYFGTRTLITPELEGLLEADFAVGQCTMFDARFFLAESELYKIPSGYYECDDLWASYIARVYLNWEIKPLYVEIKDIGGDAAALYSKSNKKQELLQKLRGGWIDGRPVFEEKLAQLGISMTAKQKRQRNFLPTDFNKNPK